MVINRCTRELRYGHTTAWTPMSFGEDSGVSWDREAGLRDTDVTLASIGFRLTSQSGEVDLRLNWGTLL